MARCIPALGWLIPPLTCLSLLPPTLYTDFTFLLFLYPHLLFLCYPCLPFPSLPFPPLPSSILLVDSIVGESSMMLYSTYNLIVSGALLLLISFIAAIDPATWVIVASSISCFAVSFSLCVLFLPKVYIEYNKVTIIASELFNNATFHKYNSYNRGFPSKRLSMLSGQSDKVRPSSDLSMDCSSRDLVSFTSLTKPRPTGGGSRRTSVDLESYPQFATDSYHEDDDRSREIENIRNRQ